MAMEYLFLASRAASRAGMSGRRPTFSTKSIFALMIAAEDARRFRRHTKRRVGRQWRTYHAFYGLLFKVEARDIIFANTPKPSFLKSKLPMPRADKAKRVSNIGRKSQNEAEPNKKRRFFRRRRPTIALAARQRANKAVARQRPALPPSSHHDADGALAGRRS